MNEQLLRNSFGIDFDATTILYSGGPIIVRVCGLTLLSIIAARFVRRAVDRIENSRTRRQLTFFAPKVVRVLVVAMGLEVAGVDVTGMAALLTTVGFTGAVVFTPLGQNMVAGLVTTIDDIYSDGDVIEVGGVYGKVVSRSLLRTELVLPDGTTAWIPNAEMSENRTLNHSRLGAYRISVEVPLDFQPDRQRAELIMLEVVDRLEWNVEGRRPMVCLDDIGGDAVLFRVYAWIADRSQEPLYRSLLLTDLVNALEAEDFSVGHTTNLSMLGSPTAEITH